jgi:hypothetical protein
VSTLSRRWSISQKAGLGTRSGRGAEVIASGDSKGSHLVRLFLGKWSSLVASSGLDSVSLPLESQSYDEVSTLLFLEETGLTEDWRD